MKRIVRSFSHGITRLVPKTYRPFLRGVGNAIGGLLPAARGFRFGRTMRPIAITRMSAGNAELQNSNPNPLEQYFDAHLEGRGIWKWRHYFDVYHRHLSKFVGREVHILEIGIYSGGSLRMWKEYFGPQCRIYGVDIEDACRVYADDTTQVYIGDQADRAFWRRFKTQVPSLDIVIDDGGHEAEQQIVSLEELLPHLGPGGVYVCEDIHSLNNPFHMYLAGLTQNLHGVDLLKDDSSGSVSAANSLQHLVQSIHLYPFVAVLERTPVTVSKFVLDRRGTQWQPFL